MANNALAGYMGLTSSAIGDDAGRLVLYRPYEFGIGKLWTSTLPISRARSDGAYDVLLNRIPAPLKCEGEVLGEAFGESLHPSALPSWGGDDFIGLEVCCKFCNGTSAGLSNNFLFLPVFGATARDGVTGSGNLSCAVSSRLLNLLGNGVGSDGSSSSL